MLKYFPLLFFSFYSSCMVGEPPQGRIQEEAVKNNLAIIFMPPPIFKYYEGFIGDKPIVIFLNANMQEEYRTIAILRYIENKEIHIFEGYYDTEEKKYLLSEEKKNGGNLNMELFANDFSVVSGIISDEGEIEKSIKIQLSEKSNQFDIQFDLFSQKSKIDVSKINDFEGKQYAIELGLSLPQLKKGSRHKQGIEKILLDFLKELKLTDISTEVYVPTEIYKNFQNITIQYLKNNKEFLKEIDTYIDQRFFIVNWMDRNYLSFSYVQYFQYGRKNFGYNLKPINISIKKMKAYTFNDIVRYEFQAEIMKEISRKVMSKYENLSTSEINISIKNSLEHFFLTSDGICFNIETRESRGSCFPIWVDIPFNDIKKMLTEDFIKSIQ